MQASSGQSLRAGSKGASASDAVAGSASVLFSFGNPGRVPKPSRDGPPPAKPAGSPRDISFGNPGRVPKPSRDGPPPAKPAGSPRDSGSGVRKAGGSEDGVAPVQAGSSVPHTLHLPSLPRRPRQEPSGQSRRWLGSKLSSSCFVDMMRKRLFELGNTPRHIVAPLRCPQFPKFLVDLVPTAVATSPKP
jgi:hypothetical protein